MSSLVNRKNYEKEDLIKVLIAFKDDNGNRPPSKEDWEAGKIKPSLRTFQRKFESINDAFEEAGKHRSVGDYKNHLYEENQKQEQRKIKRKFKMNKSRTETNDEKIPRLKQRKSFAGQHSGFPCPFCGGSVSYSADYHSSLASNLVGRFIKLLNSNNGTRYSSAVMDCIFKVFGHLNPIMRKEMEKAGYLEKYDQKFNVLSEEEE